MKKVISLLVIVLLVQFTSCSKNDEVVNTPPVIENQDFSASVENLGIKVVASDKDNDTLTFSITKNSSNNQFEINNEGVISLKNGVLLALGKHILEVEVSDGKVTASATITITLTVSA